MSSGQVFCVVECLSSTRRWGLASIGRRRAASIGCMHHERMSEKIRMGDRCSTSRSCEAVHSLPPRGMPSE